jgi:hypothetical protein
MRYGPIASPGRLLSAAWVLAWVGVASATPTACRDDEVTIFRCRTAGKRMIAVCASRGFSARQGYLQYRYGPLGRARIVLPPAGTAPADGAVMGNLMFSRGAGAALRFASGAYRYTVYSAVSSYWGMKAGVAVRRDDEQIANLRCRGEAEVQVQTQLLQRAGLVYEDSPFDMPQ